MSARLKLVAPSNVNRSVPIRPANGELRSREYLTPAEVEKLIKFAKYGRYAHRDATLILIAVRLAISRAVAVETSRGWRISKEKASHKVDVVVALAMACHAAVAKGESGKVTWEIITVPLGLGGGPPGRSFQEFLKSEEASLSPDDLHRRRVLGPDWRNRLR